MFLPVEGCNNRPMPELLHRDSDVNAVLGINPYAHEDLRQIKSDDHGGVGCWRHSTNAFDEIVRRVTNWNQSSHGLERDRSQQGDGQCEVNEEQDSPECLD